jgi:prevent-host-death family protein
MMETLTAHEARNNFGAALMMAQRTPVQITKTGKPIAVIVSIEDYRMAESLKIQMLKNRADLAASDSDAGSFADGEAFMQELADGKYD